MHSRLIFKYRSASRKGGAHCEIFQVDTKIAMEGDDKY